MTKILEIFGDGDYCVVSFEDADAAGAIIKPLLFVQAEDGKTHTFEQDGYYFEYKAHEFGDIDPDFIQFIKNEIEDYDIAKSHSFVVVEE